MTRRQCVLALAACIAMLFGCLPTVWRSLPGCDPIGRQAPCPTLTATAIAAPNPRVTKKKGVPIYADKDNSLCFVCHIDFDGEELAAQHVQHGVTCASCHGECTAHMSDEMIMTKPDILYGRTEVDRFCRKCHAKHKSPEMVEAFRKQWEGRHLPNGRSVADDSPCTDCHGKHVILKAGMTR